jgi:hypothetical protein
MIDFTYIATWTREQCLAEMERLRREEPPGWGLKYSACINRCRDIDKGQPFGDEWDIKFRTAKRKKEVSPIEGFQVEGTDKQAWATARHNGDQLYEPCTEFDWDQLLARFGELNETERDKISFAMEVFGGLMHWFGRYGEGDRDIARQYELARNYLNERPDSDLGLRLSIRRTQARELRIQTEREITSILRGLGHKNAQ